MKFTQVIIAFAGLSAVVSALPIYGPIDPVDLVKREPICFHGCEEPGREGKREVKEEVPAAFHEDWRFGGGRRMSIFHYHYISLTYLL